MPDNDSRKSLAQRLDLEYSDSMQDWEYEVSDYIRMDDFLAEYDNLKTTDTEKQSLMEIMLDSLNDSLLDRELSVFNSKFTAIVERLIKYFDLHKSSISYWKENDFLISSKLSAIEELNK